MISESSQSEEGHENARWKNRRHKHGPKVSFLMTGKQVYGWFACLLTSWLSSAVLELGAGSSLGNSIAKSVPYSPLFRQASNLKVKVLVTNLITGFITTLMILLADGSGIPYLYLPWLVNTIRGIGCLEGPALFKLARAIIPNCAFPAALSFLLVTVVLYVEQCCIWKDVLSQFSNCWINYHREREQESAGIAEGNSFAGRKSTDETSSDKRLSFIFEKANKEESLCKVYRRANNGFPGPIPNRDQ